MNFSIRGLKFCSISISRINTNEEGSFRILQLLGPSRLLLLHEPLRKFMFTILKKNTRSQLKKKKTNNQNQIILFIYNFCVEFATDLKIFKNRGKALLLYQLTIWISCKLRDKCILQDRFMIKLQSMTICKQRCLIFINSGQIGGLIIKCLIYYVGSQPSCAYIAFKIPFEP